MEGLAGIGYKAHFVCKRLSAVLVFQESHRTTWRSDHSFCTDAASASSMDEARLHDNALSVGA